MSSLSTTDEHTDDRCMAIQELSRDTVHDVTRESSCCHTSPPTKVTDTSSRGRVMSIGTLPDTNVSNTHNDNKIVTNQQVKPFESYARRKRELRSERYDPSSTDGSCSERDICTRPSMENEMKLIVKTKDAEIEFWKAQVRQYRHKIRKIKRIAGAALL